MPHMAMTTRTSIQPLYAPAQEAAGNPVYCQLQHPISELTELKRALATSQQQLKAAQEQIETLAKSNACLRRRSIQLAKKCAQARHFAYHDQLTGLPNRNLLMDRLKQAMVQSARQHKQVALLFIDLDGFKSVNDRLGHAAGDKLLQQVAVRLTASIRYGDTACRYGGDEFVILLPEINGHESAEVVTEKIRVHLAASYVVEGNVVAMTASIGVAVYQTGGQNCNDLIKQADMAMYHDKANSTLPTGSLQPSNHPKD